MADGDYTILVIEDDLPTRELYERELRLCYHVVTCDSEEQALKLLHEHVVAAVVLEPTLPDGQGWHLLAHIRATPHLHSVPIILCSTQNARRRAMTLGATIYLTKPVLPATLLETLRHVVPSAS
ncbi:response regulator [Candidatus Gracilibacteria bacterium]|nr:response regulator [Candidatus Gracilibacteria bacterium]